MELVPSASPPFYKVDRLFGFAHTHTPPEIFEEFNKNQGQSASALPAACAWRNVLEK